MGVFVILSLVLKRHREKPKRPWRIWLFDVSKQVVGQMFVHGVNVLISDLVAHRISGNACVFYFLNILIDTTLGVAIIYLLLHLVTFVFTEKLRYKGFESGQYGSPPSIKYWGKQAAVYVLSLTTMKLLVVGLFALFPGIFKIGEWLLSWTRGGDDKEYVQIIFTMGIFPITMNVLQFWLIDSIVKASADSAVVLPTNSRHDSYEDREPLFNAPEDDDGDDDHGSRPHDIENPPPRKSSRPASHEFDKNDDATLTFPSDGDHNKRSGSSTPSAPGDSSLQSMATHAYPPSLSSSPSSSYTATSRHKSKSPSSKSLRRSKPPPAPLHLQSSAQPAVNSPDRLSSRINTQPPPSQLPSPHHDDWENWEDSEDWANKVGEEDWTGRRLEEKKEALNDVWDIHTNPSGVQIRT
ncbi:hypothetical protein PLICRDRAFT_208245 [Plicaturopsis crispa FD-325 SS-3]|nr:hypothetical protein PLICRDRAFT_208245 [Plicaturopsis crispa FD-325 SS-3]